MSHIEVERKFVVTEDLESVLQSLETVQTHQISFQDKYFDTLNFSLVLNDYWLRSRGTCWELKYPVLNPCSSAASATTQYHEATTDDEIISRLNDVLQISPSASVQSVNEFVGNNNLETFACYKTQRKTFKYGDITIDIDDTDFGYSVGEVEVIVDSTEKVEEAVKRIESFGQKIGITMAERVPGKMDEYLKKHNKDLYSMLVSHHLLG